MPRLLVVFVALTLFGCSRPEAPAPISRRVLLLMTNSIDANVIAAVISGELRVNCDLAPSAHAALTLLNSDVSCMIAEAPLLLSDPQGAELAAELTRRGIAVISINSERWDETDVAGQVGSALVDRKAHPDRHVADVSRGALAVVGAASAAASSKWRGASAARSSSHSVCKAVAAALFSESCPSSWLTRDDNLSAAEA